MIVERVYCFLFVRRYKMAGSSTASWWQYSRWVWNIARSLRKTPASASENTAIETFLKGIYDPDTGLGTRTWLSDLYNKKSVMIATEYIGDPNEEPKAVDAEILGAVGRDLKKIPITDAEATAVDVLIAATGDRRYGDNS
jgi:hypothetical protein